MAKNQQPKITGIYSIINNISNFSYIGKSNNIHKRFIKHKCLLKTNKHFNHFLQNSYNKHSIEIFDFIILEECFLEMLSVKEQYWIDMKKPLIYNIDLNVLSKSGLCNGFFGKKHSKKSKSKISKALKEKHFGKNNPNYGTKNNKQVRKLMAINRAKKLSSQDVIEIRKKLASGMLHRVIAEQYNISRTIVTRIKNKTRYNLIGE